MSIINKLCLVPYADAGSQEVNVKLFNYKNIGIQTSLNAGLTLTLYAV